MSNRDKLLELLENSRPDYISGEALARELGVSRAAVWKIIRTLRADGCEIDSRTNVGYRLAQPADVLTVQGITSHLRTHTLGRYVHVFDTLDSTNRALRSAAAEVAPTGTAYLAEQQTGGRGRRGRSFFSPKGGGVYMSVLLRPDVQMEHIPLVTIAAAVSVAEAVAAVTGVQTQVKWVNDILYRGRKLCGILTEGNFDGESGRVDYLVVGMGINTAPLDVYPEDVRSIVATLSDITGGPVSRAKLAAETLNRLEYNISLLESNSAALLAQYKARLSMLGQCIEVYRGNEQYSATALDITPRGGLLVRREDGTVTELQSGEITTRVPGQYR